MRGHPPPYALALAAAFAWALYSNLARRWSEPGSGGAVEWFVAWTGLVLLILRFAAGERSVWNWRAAAEVAGLAFITALAYVLWEVAMRRGHQLLVVACSYATPLLSTGMSCAYLNLVPGPRLWLG